MATKKFYYRNKNKSPKSEVAADVISESYTAEQLSRSLKDLGISDATCELLAKNHFSTAADLVKRTEKDMYRVQGFNKKMLYEIKDALRMSEMSLREEVQKPQTDVKKNADKAPQNTQQKPQKNGRDQQKDNKGARSNESEVKSSKFGLADRRTDSKQKPQAQKAQLQKPQHQEKLTEPLPIEDWRKVIKGGKWGFSDGFKIVIPTMYDEVFCFKEGLASVEIDGKCGYIDGENNIVVPFDYDTAMSFSEGYAMVVKGDKCGYINKNNEVVIPFEYDAATPFEGGEAKVKKDGKWATITPDNKLVWI